MLIIALDDEPLLLSQLERAIHMAALDAEVRCFSRTSAALAELESGAGDLHGLIVLSPT